MRSQFGSLDEVIAVVKANQCGTPILQVSLHDLRNLKKELHQFDHHNDEVFQVFVLCSSRKLKVIATLLHQVFHSAHAYCQTAPV